MDTKLSTALTAIGVTVSAAVVRYFEGLGTQAVHVTSQESYTALLQALIECTNKQ